MSNIKRLLQEMPVRAVIKADKFHDDDYDPVKKAGRNVFNMEDHISMGNGKGKNVKDGHAFYKNRYIGMPRKDGEFDGITVTDHKSGQVKFKVQGEGFEKGGQTHFRVKSAESNASRSMRYHDVIAHAVRGGIDRWESDVQHSPGSEKAYGRLVADHADLQVHHVASNGGKSIEVTPSNIHQFQNVRGRFVVTKK